MSTSRHLLLDAQDNVAVALVELSAGNLVEGVKLPGDIPVGHKFALREIESGESVVKYAMPIGVATEKIAPGEHVHSHNLATNLDKSSFGRWTKQDFAVESLPSDTFAGFERSSGRVAIRNEIWIVNTVACVNQTATRLAGRANRELTSHLENVDGFHAFPHPYGCSQLGVDLSSTQKILAGLVNHPHAGGVLILGLGCENNRIKSQLKSVSAEKMENVVFFNTQDVADEMEEGFCAIEQLASKLNEQKRNQINASKLILGMKCGGSDGFSGITANPLLGRIADRHCSSGGTVLLTEVPEMFGAETVLLSRCASESVHDDFCAMIDEFKDYFRDHDQPISENPSPGNIDGGITTLEEKSLGCVQKGGATAPIKQVVGYGGAAAPGLGGIALINGPGNDGVSTTALTCAGANVVLFTTGRGTPLGGPVPTLKISTNTELAEKKPGWIDFDAGRLISGGMSLDKLADELFQLILQVASGESHAKNETNGYREIAIWKTGVTL